jgi:transcriptional regulator with XRE-family HTH domain
MNSTPSSLGSAYLTQQEVGAKISELRQERDVSQRALAEAVGLDPSGMSRIESGERGLAVDELVAIAAFFGVTLDMLLRRDVDAVPLFRNEGGSAEGQSALERFESVIDEFFVFEAAART